MTDDIEARDRAAARFISAAWMCEYKAAGRIQPSLDHAIVAAYRQAQEFVNSYVGDAMSFLGKPRAARGSLWRNVDHATRPSAKLADEAEATLAFIDAYGDNPKSKPESAAIDRQVFAMVIKGMSDSAIGRKVGRSHTLVAERRRDRALRNIGQRMRKVAPDIWSDTLKPHAVKVGAKMVATPPQELQLAA
jgi:hypothetical protein